MGRPPKHPTWKERMESEENKEIEVEVVAIMGYHNGSIPGCTNWRCGEIRKLPLSSVRYLEQDLPGNWKVLFPKDDNG